MTTAFSGLVPKFLSPARRAIGVVSAKPFMEVESGRQPIFLSTPSRRILD